MVHRRRGAVMISVAGLVVAGAVSAAGPAAAGGADTTYKVTVNGTGPWTNPDDTPASPFIDKDGTFYYEQAVGSYAATDPREWSFFSGKTIDDATAVSDLNAANGDTTARCNNSPTGLEATYAPAGSGYSQRNFCDLTQLWVDPDTGNWYGLVHNEFTPQPFGDGLHYDAIDYAVSTDQGKTWTIKNHAITSPYSTKRGDTAAFPEQTYYYGDGDPRLFVDTASGYFYVFYGSRVVDKGGSWKAFYEHVARAPIADKMATGSWQKWYDGHWSQPGVGGKESNMTPVTATSPTGYTAPDKEYNPDSPGTSAQQIAAGTMPPTSPLFVMDVSYDAYLGLYIAEPQAVDQSGNAPQEIYATKDLATQKWFKLGDTGSYHTASWYRWFMDDATGTTQNIVGKNLRMYCSIACSGAYPADSWWGEYAKVTIDSSDPAAPVASGSTYRIANTSGRVLTLAAHGDRTISTTSPAGKLSDWKFTANGDGSYTIANAATGKVLGVDSSTTASRAWGTKPTASTIGAARPSVGQQWWVVPDKSADGSATGSYRLVNRFSGLVLGMSAAPSRLADTTPVRSWDASGHGVGQGRTAADQTLSLSPVSE